MNNANHKFLVVLLLMVLTVGAFGQDKTSGLNASPMADSGFLKWRLSAGDLVPVTNTPLAVRGLSLSGQPLLLTGFNMQGGSTIRSIDQDLYVKGFGFFCRKELQIEKTTRIPLRVRVGSLEECNRLEQK